MHKAIMAGTTAVALLASSLMADAAKKKEREEPREARHEIQHEIHEAQRGEYRGPGPVLGFVGDVFLGVVRVATAPLALLAEIGRDGWHDRPVRERILVEDEGAYATNVEQARAYYGADARFYGPPPGHFPIEGR